MLAYSFHSAPLGQAGFVIKDTSVGRVAVPQTAAKLGAFMGLQRALNDFYLGQGITKYKLAIDGWIGPQTLKVYNTLADFVPGVAYANSVEEVANNAERVGPLIAQAENNAYNPSVPSETEPSKLIITEPMIIEAKTPLAIGSKISPKHPKFAIAFLGILAVAAVVGGTVLYVRKRKRGNR